MMEVSLRPWTMADLDSLVKYGNNKNIAKNMTDMFPHPYTAEKGKLFIEYTQQHSPANIMAIVVDGEPVGSIGIHPQSDIRCKNAELGYWLAEPFWGKGIMTKVVPQMVAYGFQHWDINRIFAGVFGTNPASQKVLENCGFKLEARFEKTYFKYGEYVDEVVYAVRNPNQSRGELAEGRAATA